MITNPTDYNMRYILIFIYVMFAMLICSSFGCSDKKILYTEYVSSYCYALILELRFSPFVFMMFNTSIIRRGEFRYDNKLY